MRSLVIALFIVSCSPSHRYDLDDACSMSDGTYKFTYVEREGTCGSRRVEHLVVNGDFNVDEKLRDTDECDFEAACTWPITAVSQSCDATGHGGIEYHVDALSAFDVEYLVGTLEFTLSDDLGDVCSSSYDVRIEKLDVGQE